MFAARRRVPAIELRTLGGTNELAIYLESRYGVPDRLADTVLASGIRIASLDSSVSLIGSVESDRGELLVLLPWARAAGASGIRVFDGGERGDAVELASAGVLLEWWRDLAVPVDLLVETHDALAQPAALQAFIEQYPTAQLLWDTHHTWKQGHELPSSTWARLRGHATHLHVKDSGSIGYVPPGDGTFPFGDLVDALKADHFAGVISLEWERHWYPDLLPIDVALDGFERVFSAFE